VIGPSSPVLELEQRSATWTFDQETFVQAVQDVESKYSNRFVTATFVGRLDVREELRIHQNEKGNVVHGVGFGELGLFPAQLVLAAVLDVAPEQSK
jgi:hypothetical protein